MQKNSMVIHGDELAQAAAAYDYAATTAAYLRSQCGDSLPPEIYYPDGISVDVDGVHFQEQLIVGAKQQAAVIADLQAHTARQRVIEACPGVPVETLLLEEGGAVRMYQKGDVGYRVQFPKIVDERKFKNAAFDRLVVQPDGSVGVYLEGVDEPVFTADVIVPAVLSSSIGVDAFAALRANVPSDEATRLDELLSVLDGISEERLEELVSQAKVGALTRLISAVAKKAIDDELRYPTPPANYEPSFEQHGDVVTLAATGPVSPRAKIERREREVGEPNRFRFSELRIGDSVVREPEVSVLPAEAGTDARTGLVPSAPMNPPYSREGIVNRFNIGEALAGAV